MGVDGRRALRGTMVLGLLAGAVALPATAAQAQAQTPSEAQVERSARATGMSRAETRAFLRDEGARVDRNDRIFYVDPPAKPAEAVGSVAEAAPYPYTQTFRLHSRPTSTKKIFLDFNGHTISGTHWNGYGDAPTGPYLAEGFSLDGDRATFTAVEQDVVQSVWQRVAEDYARFDVDVTTEDPGQEAITRSSGTDNAFGSRALITDAEEIGSSCGCGGLAYVGVFNTTSEHAKYQPAFTFAENLGNTAKNIAEATSHEVGHNLGLRHDGTSTVGYYAGHGSWAPIMGVGYSKPIVQWSKGEYSGANNLQDDLAVIGSLGLSTLADDAGNTAAAASTIGGTGAASRAAKITSDADVDFFRFNAAAGPATFSVAPAPTSPNLDSRVRVFNGAGTLLGSNNPASGTSTFDVATGLGSSVTVTIPSTGDYFVAVDGVPYGSALSTGYSGYSSVGDYRLNGSWTNNGPPPNDPFAGAISLAGASGSGTGSNARATKETGEPAHAGQAGGKSIWYRWTAPSSGVLTFDTFGSSFDTVLAAYTGSSVGALTARSSNDNSGASTQSRIAVAVVAGVTYRLAIDGKAAAGGTVKFKWNLGLANDAFSQATVLSGASGSRSGSTVGATKEPGEPNHAGDAGGKSIWYRWTAPATGTVTVRTTGSAFDTLLAVYQGTTVGSLTHIKSNDDAGGGTTASQVSFPATAGQVYRIAIDGFGGAAGATSLSWTQ